MEEETKRKQEQKERDGIPNSNRMIGEKEQKKQKEEEGPWGECVGTRGENEKE